MFANAEVIKILYIIDKDQSKKQNPFQHALFIDLLN